MQLAQDVVFVGGVGLVEVDHVDGVDGWGAAAGGRGGRDLLVRVLVVGVVVGRRLAGVLGLLGRPLPARVEGLDLLDGFAGCLPLGSVVAVQGVTRDGALHANGCGVLMTFEFGGQHLL